MIRPADYVTAARVPLHIPKGPFGEWNLTSNLLRASDRRGFPFETITVLRHCVKMQKDFSNFHLVGTDDKAWEVVMEDSPTELMRHMPIWLEAFGRVLVTGLGLGCVVRGLLANPLVEHIDVIELDQFIIQVIGQEFLGNPKVTIHHGDALTYQFSKPTTRQGWDFAWHDLWMDGPGLQPLHSKLFLRYMGTVEHRQGAWAYPKPTKRYLSQKYPLLGMKKRYARKQP